MEDEMKTVAYVVSEDETETAALVYHGDELISRSRPMPACSTVRRVLEKSVSEDANVLYVKHRNEPHPESLRKLYDWEPHQLQ